MIDTNQSNDGRLSFNFGADLHQTQRINDFGFDQGIDLFHSSTNHWANPATSLIHNSKSELQEGLPHSVFAENQNAETNCFPVKSGISYVETGIETDHFTESTFMDNLVHPVGSETVTDREQEIGDQSSANSEFSNTPLNSNNLGESSRLHRISSPSSIYSTELSACDKTHEPESITELSHVAQYDSCFGVVSH